MSKIIIWADNSAFRSPFFYCWLRQAQPQIKKSSALLALQLTIYVNKKRWMMLLSKRKFGNNFEGFGGWPSYSEFLITSVNLKML